MGLIRLQNVTKQFGDRLVLDDLSLDLSTGEIIGLVGANGTGKTTIFRLITGQLTPDIGTVTLSRGLEVGYLPQEPQIAPGQTLHDEVLSVFADVLSLERKLHEISDEISQAQGEHLAALMTQYDRTNARFDAAGGYSYEQRLGEILGGLGFAETDQKLPMEALSGGQKCRAALAKLLLQESQFLLLDEPTNHLDIDAVRWLEKFLAGHNGGAVIVSHDRYLLDRLADRIVEVRNGKVRSYPGNYTNFVQTRALRELTQERQFEMDKEFIAKERAFIAKHMGKQRTAEAKGRLKRLERRLADGEFVLDRPEARRTVKIRFDDRDEQVRAGKNVLEVEGLSKRYDEKSLFQDLSFQVPSGGRFGITGPNGTGKTTLLRIVLNKVAADTGNFHFAERALIGYYAQETNELDPERTVVQEILETRPDLLEGQARSFAARFLFRGEEPFKRVGMLSGGEQSRVRLMKIILSAPNVLILDEPTNHLDIPSREVLEEALADFAGTIVTVSHDRYFLDRICNRLLVMRPEAVKLYEGNYSYYIEQIERSQAESAGNEQRKPSKRKRAAKPDAPTNAAPKPKPTRFAKLTLDDLEALIMEREVEVMALQERFGDAAVNKNPELLEQLQDEFDEKKSDLEEAEEEWQRRAERES